MKHRSPFLKRNERINKTPTNSIADIIFLSEWDVYTRIKYTFFRQSKLVKIKGCETRANELWFIFFSLSHQQSIFVWVYQLLLTVYRSCISCFMYPRSAAAYALCFIVAPFTEIILVFSLEVNSSFVCFSWFHPPKYICDSKHIFSHVR